ncbi:MAG: DMT family transporter [Candidatus Methanoplasma sp.]|jgi:drug/metabolite transporter (DMT)-like permease|nr:DMT family transporter [Candidatus Methanoplasma sp.]
MTEGIDRSTQLKLKSDRAHGIKGTSYGLISGFSYGVNGLILTLAFTYCTPLSIAESFLAANFIAPLITLIFNDAFCALWATGYNVIFGRRKELVRALRTRPGKILFIAAIIGGPIAQGGYYIGLSTAGLAYTAGISALFVVVGPILARIFLRQVIGKRVYLGIFICVAGSIIMCYVAPDGIDSSLFYLGILCAFMAAVGWGAEGVIASFGTSVIDPGIAVTIRWISSSTLSALIFIPALTIIAVSGDFSGASMFADIISNPVTLGVLAVAGLAGAGCGIGWYTAGNMVGAGKGCALNSTYVAWGILLAIVFLGQAITAQVVVGGALVLAGAILVSWNPGELFRKGDKIV